MENVFKYYDFSVFEKDQSNAFSNNLICFTDLDATHYLVFEQEGLEYNLYVTKFSSKKDIGLKPPEILQLLVKKYDKSKPEHRLLLKQYLY